MLVKRSGFSLFRDSLQCWIQHTFMSYEKITPQPTKLASTFTNQPLYASRTVHEHILYQALTVWYTECVQEIYTTKMYLNH